MEPGTEQGAEGAAYVGVGRRTAAMLIDAVGWLWVTFSVAAAGLADLYDQNPDAGAVAFVVYASVVFNYWAILEWKGGRTVGKIAMKIKVVSLDGAESLTFAQASQRNVLRLIDFFGIGEVMIAAGERRQRLGDRLAGTSVVHSDPHVAYMQRVAAQQPSPGAVPPPPPPAPGSAERPPPPAAVSWASPPGANPPPPPPGWTGPVPEGAPPPYSPPPPPEPPPAGTTFPGWVTWSGADVLKGIGVGIVGGVLIAPLLVLPFDPKLESDGGLLAAQALLGATLIFAAVWGATRFSMKDVRGALPRLGLRSFKPSAIGWMFAMLISYYVFAIVFSTLFFSPEQEDIADELGINNENALIAVTAVLLIVVVAPISEELFFRGFVFGGLAKKFPLWAALVLGGLVFGSIHAPTGITTVIPLSVLGGGLCWLYWKTGSIWPCMVAHLINNGIAVAAGAAEDSVLAPFALVHFASIPGPF